MPIHAPIVDLSPQVRDAFDEGCRAVFKTTERRRVGGARVARALVAFRRTLSAPDRLAAAYAALDRAALETHPECDCTADDAGSRSGIGSVIEVSPGTPPSINADGKCSLIEAIVNANRNARTHLDCVAGAGPDTIVLPETSQQRLNGQQMLPQITSPIVIEGHHSTILRNTSVSTNLTFFHVSASGDLTLNETTVSGATATASGTYTGGIGVRNDGGFITLNDSSIVDTSGGLQNRAALQS